MEKRAVEDLLGRIVLVGTVLTALIISPYVAIDVFSAAKMATLLAFAAMGIGVLFVNRSVLLFARHLVLTSFSSYLAFMGEIQD